MILGQRVRLDPNNVQRTFLGRCAGAARRIWNDGLARWQELYGAGGKPYWQGLNAEVNARKTTDLAWLRELPWAVSNNALQDLGVAFTNFFRRVRVGDGKPGYPRFKKKGRCREGFAIEGRALRFEGRKVYVPKLGWVRTRQALRFPGKIVAARFILYAGHWYVSVQVEIDESWAYPHRCETQAVVGVDLGLVRLAVPSEGEPTDAPRALRFCEDRLRRLNKELARRTKGGANWHKTKAKLAKCHEKIANLRRDVTHKLTACLVHDFRWIGVEDLNVAGMGQNRHLAKSVADAAMAEVRRQLAYKSILSGSTIVVADRWFPSSKTCSSCGVVRDSLPLSVRMWACDACSAKHNRDLNAAYNLRNLAAAFAAKACRQGSAGANLAARVKLPRGQEAGVRDAVN